MTDANSAGSAARRASRVRSRAPASSGEYEPQRSRRAGSDDPTARMRHRAACLLLALAALAPSGAAAELKCAASALVLWGDGRHDDTRALNAWFRGENVAWGQDGATVGPQIADRVFLLTSALYIPSGTGRKIERFQWIWPARRERVSGGTILAGRDPNQPPVATGIAKINAGPGEGVPFPAPDPKPADTRTATDCLVS